MKRALAPLRLPGFSNLASAYTINELGNWLGEVALAILVFDQTGSPVAATALFLGMQFVPGLLGQFVVVKAEMAGTRKALPLIYLAEGVTFLVLALSVDSFSLAFVVALAALDGTLAIAARAFTRAAAGAVLAPSGQLRAGNAIINVGFTGAGAVGPAVAGLVVAGFGVQTALYIDAASFGIAAGMLLVARHIPDVRGIGESFRSRFTAGFTYVRSHQTLKRLLVVQAVAFVFFSSVLPIEIVYVNESLDAGDSGYGLLLAAWGAGMVVGSVVFAFAREVSLRLLILGSTATVGVAYVAMAFSPGLAIACLASGIGGIGNGVQWVSVVSTVQTQASEDFQARIIGLLEATAALMPGIGFVLGGLTAEVLGARASFAVAGVGILLVALVAVPYLGRLQESLGTDRQTRASTI